MKKVLVPVVVSGLDVQVTRSRCRVPAKIVFVLCLCRTVTNIVLFEKIRSALVYSHLLTFLNAQLQPHSYRVMNEGHIRRKI